MARPDLVVSTSMTERPFDPHRLRALQQAATPSIAEGIVTGIALPFETPDGRPRMVMSRDENDGVGFTFIRYTVYDTLAFADQLALQDWGGRVKFMWQHGGVDPFTGDVTFDSHEGTIPIGHVSRLIATPQALLFEAMFNETRMASEVRKAVESGDVTDVSSLVEDVDSRIEMNDEGQAFRRVTIARLWDVSLVTRAQFEETRILEARCASCGSLPVPRAATPSHTTAVSESESWEAPRLSDFTREAAVWDDLSEGEKRRITNHAAGFAGSFPPATFADIHLFHHDPRHEGVGPLNRRGLFAAAGRFNQVADIDAATRDGMASHLRTHYDQLDLEPPDVIAASASDQHNAGDVMQVSRAYVLRLHRQLIASDRELVRLRKEQGLRL